MDLEFQLNGRGEGLGLEDGRRGLTRELLSQYLSAGILFPEEIRRAERMLRSMG